MTAEPDEARIEEAHRQLGHNERRPRDRVRTLLLAGIIVWVGFLQWGHSTALDNETKLRETLVPFAVQVQNECNDPAIAEQAPVVCDRADEIVKEEESAAGEKIVPVPGEPGKEVSPEQLAAAIEKYFADHPIPLPEGATQEQVDAAVAAVINAALADYFAANPIPTPKDGQDGTDGVNGTDGRDGAPGPTCPSGTSPVRVTFKGTASIGAPAGTYLWCRA